MEVQVGLQDEFEAEEYHSQKEASFAVGERRKQEAGAAMHIMAEHLAVEVLDMDLMDKEVGVPHFEMHIP